MPLLAHAVPGVGVDGCRIGYGNGRVAAHLHESAARLGVGVGLLFLAREGLSLASLQRMEAEQESQEDAIVAAETARVEAERAPAL